MIKLLRTVDEDEEDSSGMAQSALTGSVSPPSLDLRQTRSVDIDLPLKNHNSAPTPTINMPMDHTRTASAGTFEFGTGMGMGMLEDSVFNDLDLSSYVDWPQFLSSPPPSGGPSHSIASPPASEIW